MKPRSIDPFFLAAGMAPIGLSVAFALPFLNRHRHEDLRLMDGGLLFHGLVVPFLAPLLAKLTWQDRAVPYRVERIAIVVAYVVAWVVVGGTGTWLHMLDFLLFPVSLLALCVGLVRFRRQ